MYRSIGTCMARTAVFLSQWFVTLQFIRFQIAPRWQGDIWYKKLYQAISLSFFSWKTYYIVGCVTDDFCNCWYNSRLDHDVAFWNNANCKLLLINVWFFFHTYALPWCFLNIRERLRDWKKKQIRKVMNLDISLLGGVIGLYIFIDLEIQVKYTNFQIFSD